MYFGPNNEFEVWVRNALIREPPLSICKEYYRKLFLWRTAYFAYRYDLTTELNIKEADYNMRKKELENIDENIRFLGGLTLVDTTILHDNYKQRLDLNQAHAMLLAVNIKLAGM